MPDLTITLGSLTMDAITELAAEARPPRTPEQMAAALVCMALLAKARARAATDNPSEQATDWLADYRHGVLRGQR